MASTLEKKDMGNAFKTSQTRISSSDPASKSFSPGKEMDVRETPVVVNTFSLSRDVFEQVWSSQQRVSDASCTATGDTRNTASKNTNTQYRHLSGDYVTELAGSEAKRPRLSISEQTFTQNRHYQREQQKQVQLQHIMQRLNKTREKVCRLVQLQNARERFHQHQNPADKFTDLESFQRRYVRSKQSSQALNSLHGNPQEKGRVPSFQSQFQGTRRVPGINPVTSGVRSWEQRLGGCYNPSDSAGLALDHGTLPRIVAVHSVMEKAPGDVVNHPSRGACTAFERSDKTSFLPVGVYPSNFVCEKNEICSPLTNHNTSMARNFISYKSEEVVLINGIPGKSSRSNSGLFCNERKHEEVSLRRKHNKNSVEHAYVLGDASHTVLADPQGRKDQKGVVDYTGDKDNLGTVDHQRSASADKERPGNVSQSENVDNPVSINITQTKKAVELSQKEQNGVSSEHSKKPDSDMYLGGPPPYLPTLDKSEMMKRDKKANQHHSVHSPTFPRLAKTVLEISEKIIQTRERVKNETIEWKKCVLFKLEKRLIQKLRRAERLTGQKTEIEDLRDEVPETVANGKRGKGQGQRRRSGRKESVTENATDGDTPKSQGQVKSLSRKSSVNDSVTDDESVNCHGQEKRSDISDSVTNYEDNAGENQNEEMGNDQLHNVTDSMIAEVEESRECPHIREKEKHSDKKPTECSELETVEKNFTRDKEMNIFNDLTEKCNDTKNIKITCAQEKNIESCENVKDTRKYDVDQSDDVKATNANSNCVAKEHPLTTTLQMKGESKLIDTESTTRRNTELRYENSEKQLHCDEDKKEFGTMRINARENHRQAERKNIFEIFKPRFRPPFV